MQLRLYERTGDLRLLSQSPHISQSCEASCTLESLWHLNFAVISGNYGGHILHGRKHKLQQKYPQYWNTATCSAVITQNDIVSVFTLTSLLGSITREPGWTEITVIADIQWLHIKTVTLIA